MTNMTIWNKFMLLLWKNLIIQWNHKWKTILELVSPIFFALIFVVLRYAIPTSSVSLHIDDIGYNIVDFSNKDFREGWRLEVFNLPVYYSPANDVLDTFLGDNLYNITLIASKNAVQLESDVIQNKALAGIQFDDAWANLTDRIPDDFRFALRFPSEPNYWRTNELFPTIDLRGPNHGNPRYFEQGFLALQHSLSMAFIRDKGYIDDMPTHMQYYPYPTYTNDNFITWLTLLLPCFIVLNFTYHYMGMIKFIVAEKEKQLKEIMKVLGLGNWLQWTAWFVKFQIPLTLSAIFITAILKIDTKNGAILPNTDPTALLFFLVVYFIANTCFCFMVSSMFSKARRATTVMALVSILALIPYFCTFHNASLCPKVVWSLVPNSALGLGFKVIVNFEEVGDGLQWRSMFTPASEGNPLTMGVVIITMMVSSVACMIICLYVEKAMPGGIEDLRPWYLSFTQTGGNTEGQLAEVETVRLKQLDPSSFEAVSENKQIGLKITNLTKRFDDKTAVKGLSMNLYQDEITVLLGHNGAGKSTTISILTGAIPATRGNAIINGSDITKNAEEARRSIGICPQQTVLFDEMSASNHIRFFSRIKGLRGEAVEMEVTKYLSMIGLEHKGDVVSSKLSDEMKRKLSVCCALCGGSKVVLLDAPSSGMDPSARRQVWDLLQKEKFGRTLLLTTHLMDEADVLADRIAIMCDGELQCHGTSLFLKKRFGSGYQLTIAKRKDCSTNEVTALLNKYIPGLRPERDNETELSYQLPDSLSPRFEEMFSQLEERSEELHLNGFGVKFSTLEEVFLKVGVDNESTENDKNPSGMMNGKEQPHDIFEDSLQPLQGLQLLLNQCKAMFLKKGLYTWRKKYLLFVTHVILLIFLVTSFLNILPTYDQSPMTISLAQYPSTVSVVDISEVGSHSLEYKMGQEYANLVNSYGGDHKVELTGTKNFKDYILGIGDAKQTGINPRYLVGVSISYYGIAARLNNQAYHAAPLSLNLAHNALARAAVHRPVRIEVTNAPLHYSKPSKDGFGQLREWYQRNYLSYSLCLGMLFVCSIYVVLPIEERRSNAKLLQFVGGVKAWIFWLTQFASDFAIHLITCLIVFIPILFLLEPGYLALSELGILFIVLIIFGFSVIPFIYLMSFFVKNTPTVFIWNALLFVFTLIGYTAAAMNEFKIHFVFKLLFSLFPQISILGGVSNVFFVRFFGKQKCTSVDGDTSCNSEPFYENSNLLLTWESPGVLSELVSMICSGVFFFFITLLLESRVIQTLMFKMRQNLKKTALPPPEGHLEEDVDRERSRILCLTQDEVASKKLVMDRLTKNYGKFLAVNQVSFCLNGAECFGLLGANGAGKTTTLKVMTGEERISSGTVHVQGKAVGWNMSGIYQVIGYCPQFDALPEALTGREVLRIFCLLGGVRSASIRQVSEDLARSLGFSMHLDERTESYSAANKRKLSTAIAVVGSSSVVLLDEPSSGLDPAARRQLWNVVSRIRDSGKSIILSSHNMEEGEALCTRLAIMGNGKFLCLGSTQHLKSKFSKGLILKIKVKETNAVIEFIRSHYPHSVLRYSTLGLLTFVIPLNEAKWSGLFVVMEENRVRLGVEEYSVSQTSLEDIYLDLLETNRDQQ
ncbi:phospholipid-transporting ATPase ABCA3-like isoform X2 [Drosophila ficusphila]|uniref:phospholipid-transporting ATPase ABCA3-like isoform X2 n=1 Tax=Drosophila ficusphila TaxID=30025 RepID=UPI0007E621DA|nr:phospholipid-transporting ATPase ABCA3-like isoform X2 [Drosophila ficusphila]